MAKISLRQGKNADERHAAIGKAIIDAWREAYDKDDASPKLNLRKLAQTLSDELDLEKRGSGKKIEIDLVVDSDLDSETRLIWLAIPMLEIPAGANFDKWLDDEYLTKKSKSREAYAQELGGAVLFGCGR
jgi:hypothetical protein